MKHPVQRMRAAAARTLALISAGGLLLGVGAGIAVSDQPWQSQHFTASTPDELHAKIDQHYQNLQQYGLSHRASHPAGPPPGAGQFDSAWPEGIQPDVDQLSPAYDLLNMWEHSTDATNIAVYAGGSVSDPTQGVLWVQQEDRAAFQTSTDLYVTPTSHGPVRVTSANGSVLTLTASDSTTFAFNVDSRTFVG